MSKISHMEGKESKRSSGDKPASDNLAALGTQIQYIKGVGPDRAEAFERIGIRTVRDLLFYFPRDYKDASETLPISELEEGVEAKVVGVVEEIEQRTLASGKTIAGVLIREGNSYLRATWFNQPYILARIRRDQQVILEGSPKLCGLTWEMTHPKLLLLDEVSAKDEDPLIPIYRLTDGIKQHHIKRAARHAVHTYASVVPETLPDWLRKKRNLFGIEEALENVHAPSSKDACERARYRLVYQELLVMQIALAIRRHNLRARSTSPILQNSSTIDGRIRRLFSFELTPDQNQTIEEICEDLVQPIPMNRLVQGDVGTGKTAVAAYAALVAIANKHQVVMMAPTEALAQQHFRTFGALLKNSQVKLRLLSGSTTASERKEVIEDIESGSLDFLVATQAVLHLDASFRQLGLVIIDEQHKFGVRQRALLRQGDSTPHYLVMTATPIPRTVAMTLFGDLDVSILRNTPPGRSPVKTYWSGENQRDQWWEFFRKKLREGRQGYVISPLVDEEADHKLGAEQI
ncbi:MAG: DEAD/DEAH box helicase, partial [Planctomycetales bacterium]|nr:DEAD/DEAH box helicase [Planctomycetales bacterium]